MWQAKIEAVTIREFKNYDFDSKYLRQSELKKCFPKLLIV